MENLRSFMECVHMLFYFCINELIHLQQRHVCVTSHLTSSWVALMTAFIYISIYSLGFFWNICCFNA